jgi:hypothetical protein
MREAVSLARNKVRKAGREYVYWTLRWFSADGKKHGKVIGRTDQISKRQAEKLRRKKEAELANNPGRRDASRSPELGGFLQLYLAARKSELAPGSHELHDRTARYLEAFFGSHRRLETISRAEARAFKTALANNELAQVKKQQHRKEPLASPTVDQHIRNARTIFNHAKNDDLITFNPFDRLAEGKPIVKDWHYVDLAELGKLMAAARPAWQLLFALARLAALRLEEALELPWRKIDWTNRRLRKRENSG